MSLKRILKNGIISALITILLSLFSFLQVLILWATFNILVNDFSREFLLTSFFGFWIILNQISETEKCQKK